MSVRLPSLWIGRGAAGGVARTRRAAGLGAIGAGPECTRAFSLSCRWGAADGGAAALGVSRALSSSSSSSSPLNSAIRKVQTRSQQSTTHAPHRSSASSASSLHHTSARAFSTTRHLACPPSTSKSPEEKMAEKKDMQKYLQQTHDKIFDSNKKWAEEQKAKNPQFFEQLSAGQAPEYLWIGCSDSRIPAEAITGLGPGEMFIHRNIANLVCNVDLNAMSVVNYAVRHLKVKHIIVCGHYGCGGVKAAMSAQDLGLLNPWLRNIRDVYRLHEAELDGLESEAKYDRLVELNVVEQCRNVIKTAAVQRTYEEGGFPVVHGWVFGFKDGLLKDLKIDHQGILRDIQKIYNLCGSPAEE